jgi:nucleotide-binding universal stress UspA family protein
MRILLAIDGSPFSDVATHMLTQRPWPPGSVVRVLSVVQEVFPVSPAAPVGVPLVTETPVNYEDVVQPRIEEAERLVSRTAETLRSTDLGVETAMRRGDPRKEVVEEAQAWNADLIVLGSHGRTGVERLLMGSVSEGVMRHAPCSVEVVRAPRAQEGS